LLTGVDTFGSARFRYASNKINTPQVAFTIAAQQLLNSRLPDNIAAFQDVLTADICDLAIEVLTSDQYISCKEEKPNINAYGVLATMSYSQRILQQAYNAILQNGPPSSQLQLGVLDPLFFY